MESKPEAFPLNTSSISTRQDFIAFLQQLKTEYVKSGNDWENQNLNDFLEALVAYTADIPDYYNNMSASTDAESASWRVFADIIRGATIYE